MLDLGIWPAESRKGKRRVMTEIFLLGIGVWSGGTKGGGKKCIANLWKHLSERDCGRFVRVRVRVRVRMRVQGWMHYQRYLFKLLLHVG